MNEQIVRILRHPATIPALVGVGSFAAGFGAGLLFEKRQKARYEEPQEEPTVTFERQPFVIDAEDYEEVQRRTEQAFDEAIESFPEDQKAILRKRFDQNPKAAQEMIESVVSYVSENPPEDDDEDGPETETRSVFPSDIDSGWDYEIEVTTRTDGEPHVIHRDEYILNENDWDQSTFTYYEGDDIMADVSDSPVYNYPTVMGELKFGHGSGDPNVVYIRNPDLRREYEILRHTGHFSVEVDGLEAENGIEEDELKHSSHMRFRED